MSASNSKANQPETYAIGNETGCNVVWKPHHLRTGEDVARRGLNLGCGKRFLHDCVNHDKVARLGVDHAWDLNKLPWPWMNNQFRYVSAWAVLEHLDIDLLTSMNEIHRILDGTLDIKLPYWQSTDAHKDPTHRWFFHVDVFDMFDPETERGRKYDFYTDRKWQIISKGWAAEGESIQAQMETIK